jgi:hypothetical protein
VKSVDTPAPIAAITISLRMVAIVLSVRLPRGTSAVHSASADEFKWVHAAECWLRAGFDPGRIKTGKSIMTESNRIFDIVILIALEKEMG